MWFIVNSFDKLEYKIFIKANIKRKYLNIQISINKYGLIFSTNFLKKQYGFLKNIKLSDYIIRYIELWCFEYGFIKYKKNKD